MAYWLDNEERPYKPGLKIKDALSAEEKDRADAGRLKVFDEFGHLVGLEGALEDGGSYFTVVPGARPPSVDRCLGLLDEPYPRGFLKLLVNDYLDRFRGSPVVPSANAVAAGVRRKLVEKDLNLIFDYVTDKKYNWAVYERGAVESLFRALGPGPVVIAVREVLAFSDGSSFPAAFGPREVREVGTTNKVKLADYAEAAASASALVVAKSARFSIEGFTGEPAWADIAKLARENGARAALILDGYGLFSEKTGEGIKAGFDDVVLVNTPEAPGTSVVLNAKDKTLELAPTAPGAPANVDVALWDALKKEKNG